jgi:hypothetical protein
MQSGKRLIKNIERECQNNSQKGNDIDWMFSSGLC